MASTAQAGTTKNHDVNGRFKPGNKAAAKAAHNRSVLARIAKTEELDQVVRGILDRALAGDQQAAEYIGNKFLPPLKAQHEKAAFNLDASNLESAVKSVIAAIADGTLAPDVGKTMVDSLKGAGDIGTMATLAQKVADLEARLNSESSTLQVLPDPVVMLDGRHDPVDPVDTPNNTPRWTQESADDANISE